MRHTERDRHPEADRGPVLVKDPVCGMDVRPGEAAGGNAEHAGTTYWFCSPRCREKFVAPLMTRVPDASVRARFPSPPDPR
jgi:YHS domain-containing protein